MGNTPNNNFPFPEPTDLVKDGAQAIEDLADAIDTTLGVYAPSTPGLTLINTTSFSGVTSFSIGSDAAPLFSSTYENYYFELYGVGVNAGLNINARLRANVTDASGSNYVQNEIYNQAASVSAASTTTTLFKIGYGGNVGFVIKGSIFRPFLAARTFLITDTFSDSTTPQLIHGRLAGEHNLSTSYNGLTVLSSSGNIEGSIAIYGVNR
jgi:hypothetical protein